MVNRRKLGTEWEERAVTYLKEQQYEILKQNYRCRYGEIDIIARKMQIIVFVEVKYRNSDTYGTAIEAVTVSKQNTIRKVAQHYLTTQLHSLEKPCRFDVIAIDQGKISHIQNAF